MGLPVARLFDLAGQVVEGPGVTPSISVAQPPEQLLAGEVPQMRRVLEMGALYVELRMRMRDRDRTELLDSVCHVSLQFVVARRRKSRQPRAYLSQVRGFEQLAT